MPGYPYGYAPFASPRRESKVCKWFLQWVPCYQPRRNPYRPWTFTLLGAQAVVQVVMCILLLVLAIVLITPENAQHALEAKTLANLFHPDGADFSPSETGVLFYDVDDALDFVEQSVQNGLDAEASREGWSSNGWYATGRPVMALTYTAGELDYRALVAAFRAGFDATDVDLPPTGLNCTLGGENPLGPLATARNGSDALPAALKPPRPPRKAAGTEYLSNTVAWARARIDVAEATPHAAYTAAFAEVPGPHTRLRPPRGAGANAKYTAARAAEHASGGDRAYMGRPAMRASNKGRRRRQQQEALRRRTAVGTPMAAAARDACDSTVSADGPMGAYLARACAAVAPASQRPRRAPAAELSNSSAADAGGAAAAVPSSALPHQHRRLPSMDVDLGGGVGTMLGDAVGGGRLFSTPSSSSSSFSSTLPAEEPARAENDPLCDGVDDVLWRAERLTISYRLTNNDAWEKTPQLSCHQWDVRQHLDFSHSGFIGFSLDLDVAYCSPKVSANMPTKFDASSVLILFICLLAVASLFFNACGVVKVWVYRKELRASNNQSFSHYESGTGVSTRVSSKSRLQRALSGNPFNTPTVKLLTGAGKRMSDYRLEADNTDSVVSSMMSRLHDMVHEIDSIDSAGGNLTKSYEWLLLGCVGDVLCIVACMLDWIVWAESRTPTSLNATTWLFGLAIFLEWAFLISHMGDQPQFYVLVATLQNCVPLAMRYVVGCAPLFFGYACMGTYVFGPFVAAFETVDLTCASLFAVGNGDVMHDFFDAAYDALNTSWYHFFARLFFYTFVMSFLYFILNLFLAIMEDTYHQVKQALLEDLKDDLSEIRSSSDGSE